MSAFMKKIFGSHSSRELKKIYPIADKVEALDEKYASMSEEELKGSTEILKSRIAAGETLDDILPDAFAVMREASFRVLGMKHYRVQIIGGIVLHQGRISEMRTGEGKTLMATLPAYLNALSEKGVHIVTVNDYLAKRDSEWMGKVYKYLGLTVGLVIHDVPATERKGSYAADITYGTNNEYGFDYLRDNMAIYKEAMVQRGHNFCIIDEVDSILVDEARTPLIISGQGEKSSPLYQIVDGFAKKLTVLRIKETDNKEDHDDIQEDYVVDEKAKTATLTPNGIEKAESAFNIENLLDPEHTVLLHHINQAIRANGIMRLDVDYVINDGEIVIVDEFTGRLMFGRRYSEGLHQAIEAKENVKVAHESKTLATITFQNYFRLYKKLSGMTGTAITEEDEFKHIYKLDVVEIPTNKPIQRIDYADAVYKSEDAKVRATINKIKECHEKLQPILVGTVSIEKSVQLSNELKKLGIKHNVLNAKFHEQEAEIVAQAGKLGAVTIATNMAGRGTDIVLGGNAEFMAKDAMRKAGFSEELIIESDGHAETNDSEILNARAEFEKLHSELKKQTDADAAKVCEAGGLFILGTERHESRRIDNQLRGRAGRQGDPGTSTFYLSLQDDLMRLFGSDKMMGMLERLGMEEDTPIDEKILSNAIESAQKKVEGRNFAVRKHVLEYDDVMNKQREIIYGQRLKVLLGENIKDSVLSMIKNKITENVTDIAGDKKSLTKIDYDNVLEHFNGLFNLEFNLSEEEIEDLSTIDFANLITGQAINQYNEKEEEITEEIMRELERVIMLKSVDENWIEHIDAMQELRNGINLRAYAQKDPIVEYKHEGFDMFDHMISVIQDETVRGLFLSNIRKTEEAPQREQVAKEIPAAADGTLKKQPIKKSNDIGRNDPCPCGSTKKYKKCCGGSV